jgi:hypothetical protein
MDLTTIDTGGKGTEWQRNIFDKQRLKKSDRLVIETGW